MGRFDGRVAIVTGAGSGLGQATAHKFAADGAAVACLDIAHDAVDATAEAIAAAGGTARAYRADVSDPDSVRAAVDGAAKDLGRPSLVVTCAGIGRFFHSHEMPFADWQTHHRRQPHRHVPHVPGRAAAPARRRRQHRRRSRRTRASWASRTAPRTARRRPGS